MDEECIFQFGSCRKNGLLMNKDVPENYVEEILYQLRKKVGTIKIMKEYKIHSDFISDYRVQFPKTKAALHEVESAQTVVTMSSVELVKLRNDLKNFMVYNQDFYIKNSNSDQSIMKYPEYRDAMRIHSEIALFVEKSQF
ncbi:hypothetical protein MXB_357 [Myxobolus squamalis]|nr:hypothetical protein MXB_357 [Myxobolus squamalis]